MSPPASERASRTILISTGRGNVTARHGAIIMWVRYRAGLFGTFNALLGVVFLPAFTALGVLCCVQIARGVDVSWSSVGAVFAFSAAAVMVLVLLSGVSTWRAVVLSSAGLSIPGFSARRGFFREQVALIDILQVRLFYRSEPRNGRWQLEVTQRHGPPLSTDSITSSRGSGYAGQTRAGQQVGELQAAIYSMQHPKG